VHWEQRQPFLPGQQALFSVSFAPLTVGAVRIGVEKNASSLLFKMQFNPF
jgi:hypothetical protein